MGFLNDEIPKVRAAALRHLAVVNDYKARWSGVCCPGCEFGTAYTEATEQVERTAKWLAVLLKKRGEPEDLELARIIDAGYWP